MPEIVAYEDVKATRIERQIAGRPGWRTNFILPKNGAGAQGFLVESPAHRVLRPHFHKVDQFQMFIHGGGTLGKHAVVPQAVHFSRAYTPYGPLTNGDDGIGWLTLRPQPDPGAQYMPESREALHSIQDRKPWQTTGTPDLQRIEFDGEGVAWQTLPDLQDANGLSCRFLALAPHAETVAPDPASGGGQYVVVTSGALLHGGREYAALTVGFIQPGERPLPMKAGPEGLQATILNFPRPSGAGARRSPAPAGTSAWLCSACGLVYEQAAGLDGAGISPGTHWDDVPADFVCPDCGSGKADFEPVDF